MNIICETLECTCEQQFFASLYWRLWAQWNDRYIKYVAATSTISCQPAPRNQVSYQPTRIAQSHLSTSTLIGRRSPWSSKQSSHQSDAATW